MFRGPQATPTTDRGPSDGERYFGIYLALIAKRLGLGLVTLFAVSIIIFAAIEALPGNFAQEILGQGATPEAIAAIERDLGLDKGPVERYFGWLGGVLVGDFGVPFAQLSFAGNFGTANRDIITVADQDRAALRQHAVPCRFRRGHRGAGQPDDRRSRGALSRIGFRPLRKCLHAVVDFFA